MTMQRKREWAPEFHQVHRLHVWALGPMMALGLLLSVSTAQAQTPAVPAAPGPKAEPVTASSPAPATVGADAPTPATPRAEAAAPAPAPGAGSPSAQAALQTLLNSQVGRADPSLREVPVATGAAAVAAAGAAAVGAQGRVVVNVARGQSLDPLLKQHLTSSPLRVEVLRELVRQLNPQAFAPGNGYRLIAGARLQLPSTQDQAQHAFGKVLAASMATAPADAEDRGGPSGTAGARKGWVRYP